MVGHLRDMHIDRWHTCWDAVYTVRKVYLYFVIYARLDDLFSKDYLITLSLVPQYLNEK